MRSATTKIKASGLDVRLDIVGFTLTGQSVAAQLDNLAGSTDGRYYGAQDGAQPVRVAEFAALQRVPYDVLDARGNVVANGEISELSGELPAGEYRLRVGVLDQNVEAQAIIVSGEATVRTLNIVGDRVLLQ